MASGNNNNNNNNKPWYKKKLDRSRYLDRGYPDELTHDTVAHEIPGLIPAGGDEAPKLSPEMAKLVVDQKNKKREFLIEYDVAPKKKTSGGYFMTMEVLHVDYRGFLYKAEGKTEGECSQAFWPMVPLLMAHYFSPKIVGRPGGDVTNNTNRR